MKLLICLIGALLLVETISFHGHFYQSSDFYVRNPIYQSLIDKPWPLYDARGKYFIYYHALWLPPALLAKGISGILSSQTILFIWSYLYFVIAIGLLFCKIKGRVLSFLIIFFMLGTIVPDCLHVLNKLIGSHYAGFSDWLIKHDLEEGMHYVSFWSSFTYSFNSALPGFLCLSLLFSGMLPKRYWCVPAAFIVQPALLCAGALFFWLLWTFVTSPRALKETLVSPHTWGCVVLVALELLYFCCLGEEDSGNGIHFVWSQEIATPDGPSALWRTIRAILLPAPLILSLCWLINHRLRRSNAFIGGCLIASIIPFVWIGIINNELCFKGSFALYFLFAWVLTAQWQHSDSKHKVIIMIFLLLSCRHISREFHSRHFFTDYGWSEEKISRHIYDPYHGSIDNMSSFIQSQFFGENRFPAILRDCPQKHTNAESQ